ncbi:hypothetical protein SNEBB_001024 [Seison nebaliae]|nr:hypothetical protein SNEBB_001024 [Seison nebaliae]
MSERENGEQVQDYTEYQENNDIVSSTINDGQMMEIKEEMTENSIDENENKKNILSGNDLKDYQTIVDSGCIDNLSDLDERALVALKEIKNLERECVIVELKHTDYAAIENLSAYICALIKSVKQRNKVPEVKAMDPKELDKLLKTNDYRLEISSGQRKCSNFDKNFADTKSSKREVFCGKLPKDAYEYHILPIFLKIAPVASIRTMMDPNSGFNRGYCFITYFDNQAADTAVKQLNNYEIMSGRNIRCNISVANVRLFIGKIPKIKSKEEIEEQIKNMTDQVKEVIVYPPPISDVNDNRKNRGFCFVIYEDHKSASVARHKLTGAKMFGVSFEVDWAEKQDGSEEVTETNVCHIGNLATEVTEEILREKFSPFGNLTRVKKIKDYAFIDFETTDECKKAIGELNGLKLFNNAIEVCFAKPPSTDSKRRDQSKKGRGKDMNGRGGHVGMMGNNGGNGMNKGMGNSQMNGGRNGLNNNFHYNNFSNGNSTGINGGHMGGGVIGGGGMHHPHNNNSSPNHNPWEMIYQKQHPNNGAAYHNMIRSGYMEQQYNPMFRNTYMTNTGMTYPNIINPHTVNANNGMNNKSNVMPSTSKSKMTGVSQKITSNSSNGGNSSNSSNVNGGSKPPVTKFSIFNSSYNEPKTVNNSLMLPANTIERNKAVFIPNANAAMQYQMNYPNMYSFRGAIPQNIMPGMYPGGMNMNSRRGMLNNGNNGTGNGATAVKRGRYNN